MSFSFAILLMGECCVALTVGEGKTKEDLYLIFYR